MICITNTLPNKLEVCTDNDTHELRSGETMVLAPSKTAFKCQVKINCESNIKIAWLALWTGVFTGEQIKPKIICNSEFTFEGIDEVYWPCSHSRAMPSFPSQLEWKIGLAWANTRGILNSPS